jgi:ABC-type branched-subunit amino acid transport system substrate-binding protein
MTLLGGCVAFALGPISTAGAQEELRIGYVAPTTGIFAQVGKDMVDGFQMYLNEVKHDFGGAKVKFIVEDEQGKPDTAVTKAKKLILQDKVHMFVGGLLASTGYALAPVSTEYKTMYISSIAAADDLTQRDLAKYPYFMRTGWSSSQPSHPFGQWACEQGYKKIVALGADYAFGYEVVGGFQRAFEACGGQVIQKIWPPLGTKDFGPYIPTIKRDADAIFSLMVGPMSLQFPKQLRAAGNKKPVIGGGTSYDEFVLPAMGDEVLGHARYAEECGLCEGVPGQVWQGALLLFGEQLHHRADDPRGDQEERRQVSGRRGVHQAAFGDEVRHAARTGQLRRHAQPGAERLHQEGRAQEDVRLHQGRALEHRDQDLPKRRSVRAVQEGRVPEDAGLWPRLSALQVLQLAEDMAHPIDKLGATPSPHRGEGWGEGVTTPSGMVSPSPGAFGADLSPSGRGDTEHAAPAMQ